MTSYTIHFTFTALDHSALGLFTKTVIAAVCKLKNNLSRWPSIFII